MLELVLIGNGQAAASLANHFDRVIATDRSATQIAHAQQRDNITYKVGKLRCCSPVRQTLSFSMWERSVGKETMAARRPAFDKHFQTGLEELE